MKGGVDIMMYGDVLERVYYGGRGGGSGGGDSGRGMSGPQSKDVLASHSLSTTATLLLCLSLPPHHFLQLPHSPFCSFSYNPLSHSHSTACCLLTVRLNRLHLIYSFTPTPLSHQHAHNVSLKSLSLTSSPILPRHPFPITTPSTISPSPPVL